MDEAFETLPITSLRSGRLHDLQPNQVFVPYEGAGVFLAGMIGDTLGLICLRDPDFEVAGRDRWARMRGYVIDDVRFEVDRSTAKQVYGDSDLEKGQVVRFDGGFGICGVERQAQWLLELTAPENREGGLGDLVAFRRWIIVTGLGLEKRTLFTYTGEELVDGPFDSDCDQLA